MRNVGFLCFLRNYHTLSGLKQRRLIISLFLWLGSLGQLSWILCPGLPGCDQGVSGAAFLLELGVLFQAQLVAEFFSLCLYDLGRVLLLAISQGPLGS